MVIKVVTYLNVEGKFSVEEGNELIRDCRIQINDFLINSFRKGTKATLSNHREVFVEFLTEAEAKKKVIGSAKIDFANPTSYPQTKPSKLREEAMKLIHKSKNDSK